MDACLTSRPLRVLVCGDRAWADAVVIGAWVRTLAPGTTVITGGARGADRLAEVAARDARLPTRVFPADWLRYGRRAGPIRNRQMLHEGRPDQVVAFHTDLEHSRGTGDMVRAARAAGVPVVVIRGAGVPPASLDQGPRSRPVGGPRGMA